MSGTEWFCGVQLGGVKLPAEFPAARNSKSMVHAGTGRWRQKNGRTMLIVGSRLAVYRMAVVLSYFIARSQRKLALNHDVITRALREHGASIMQHVTTCLERRMSTSKN